jgi:hypothetical protein
MQTATFGYGSSEADQAMLKEGASLKVRALTGLIGIFLDRDTARGAVRLRVSKYDRDGKLVTAFSYNQYITLVRQGGTWLVDEAPRT